MVVMEEKYTLAKAPDRQEESWVADTEGGVR